MRRADEQAGDWKEWRRRRARELYQQGWQQKRSPKRQELVRPKERLCHRRKALQSCFTHAMAIHSQDGHGKKGGELTAGLLRPRSTSTHRSVPAQ